MAERFRHRAGDLPIAVPPILAADVEQFTEVQVVLPGRAMGRMILHAVPGRRDDARRAYRLIGRAISVIESLDPPIPAVPRTVLDEGPLGDLEPALPRLEFDRLVNRLSELHTEVAVSTRKVCAHGDMNSAHVLWTGQRLVLVDLLWGPRWQGHDLAEQASRVHDELPTRNVGSMNWSGAAEASAPRIGAVEPCDGSRRTSPSNRVTTATVTVPRVRYST